MTIIGRWFSPENSEPPGKPASTPADPATTQTPEVPSPAAAEPPIPNPQQPALQEILREIADKGPNPSLPILQKMCESWIQNKVVSEKNLRMTLASLAPKAKERFIGHLLVESGLIIEEEILYALAKICRIPIYNLSQYEINLKALPLVTHDQAYEKEILPVDFLGKILTIAVTNPFTDLSFLTEKKLNIRKILCPRHELRANLDVYYPPEMETAVIPAPVPPPPAHPPVTPAPFREAMQEKGAAPASKTLDAIFAAWSHVGNGAQAVLARKVHPDEIEFYVKGAVQK